MNEMKRVLALLLCVVMLVGVMPVGALAAEAETTAPSEALEVQATEAAAAAAETEVAEIETTAVTEAPVLTASEEAYSAQAEGFVDAAIFCSDVHGSTSDLTSVLGGVATSNVDYSAIGFDGDTCLTVANTTSIVRSALSDTDIEVVFSYASSHDTENSADIKTEWDYSGEAFDNGNYIIYTIREDDMKSDTGADENFTTWYSGLSAAKKAQPIFILSHRPLHDRRDDNAGAAGWYAAISAAAESSDIVFFWAHNHTSENDVDTAAYYVAKDGTEKFTVYQGDTVVPNFTYMNAGYINANNQNPGRIGVATTVQITDTDLVFQDYNSSGEYTGTYAHNVEVAREFASAESEAYVTAIAITTDPAKTEYYLGETLDTTGMVVTATYSDGTTAEITPTSVTGYDMSTAGTQKVSVNYYDNGITFSDTFEITVTELAEDAVLTGITVNADAAKTEYWEGDKLLLDGLVVTAAFSTGDTVELQYKEFSTSELYGGYELDNFNMNDGLTTGKTQTVTVTYTYGEVTCTASYVINVWTPVVSDSTSGISVAVTEDYGVASVAVKESENTNVAAAIAAVIDGDNYVAWDISLTFDEGYTVTTADKTVTLPIPEGVENPVVYYVSDDGLTVTDMKAEDNGNGTVSFVTDHFSTYVVGNGTNIEVDDPVEAEGEKTTKTSEEKEVYVLVSSISSADDYLIVNTGSATTSANLLTASSNGVTNTSGVTVVTGTDANGDSVTYIEDPAAAAIWTASSYGSGYRLYNSSTDRYLRYNSGLTTSSSNATTWYSGTNTVYKTDSTRYIRYNNGWTSNSSSSTVYIYQKQPVSFETTTTVKGTYSIAGEDITTIVTAGDTATLTSTLTFTPDSGTATTEDVSATATYEIVSDPNGVMTLSGNTVTYTGNTGKALVKVSYESEFGTVTNYITVNASAPYYTIELHKANDGTVGDLITAPVVLKNINGGDTYSVWAVVKEHTSTDPDGADLGDVDDDRIKWTISNVETSSGTDESIAIVNPATGVITFTGDAYGTFKLTATYLDKNGDPLCEDTITISVSENAGVVPGDGTNDFPEYPNEGAVRIDKTATAVGNFSETGIAKVELSMTGVPYTIGNEMDVVVMLDMSTSMDDTRIAATVAATQAFIDSIVKNEDGTYNSNRVYVGYFNGDTVYTITDSDNIGGELASVDNDTEYDALISDIEDEYDGALTASGTNYDVSLEECYNVLNDIKTTESATEAGYNRSQFVVFMSDGGPTDYATSASNVISESNIVGYFEVGTAGSSDVDPEDYTNTVPDEYWSGLMKENDVTIYSVGLILQEQPSSGPQTYRSYSDDQYYYITKTLLTGISSGEDYFFNCESSSDTAEMEGIFKDIAQKILEAATNVKVTDEIGENYTLNFSFPEGVTTDHTGVVTEFYIQVVEYTLDSDHERDGEPAVLENFTFNANGTLKSHTVDGTVCSDCTHVTTTDGVITKIDGTYFDYERTGDTEFLYWNSDKLTNKELALQYFAHLDDSSGTAVADQIAAGSYYTNEEATVTYTNFQGTECELTFPKPQMTWNGAQVTYKFYLVNSNGEPVNRAGKVVPFTEAVWVSEDYTHAVTWNDLEGNDKVFAQEVAALAEVPGVYTLYDSAASYEVRVYQTESVDTNGTNFNYFRISGGEANGASGSTTKVYNTLAGTKYSKYGVYSHMDVNTDVGNGYTVQYKTTDIDYANTTVAFAVLWTPTLVEDTIIVDYGLDVEVDVSINDMVETELVGVRDDQPYDGNEPVAINTGVIPSAKVAGTDTAAITIGDDNRTIGTAEILNNTFIKFSLDKPTESAASNAMLFDEPAVIYYESQYHWLNSTTNSYQDDIMYSSLTVIPASTVYYEDEYVTLKTFTKQEDGTYKESAGWDTNSKAATATQAVDRPGTTANMENVEDWDANNNYGYDDAYGNCATYSMDNAAMINVTKEKYGTASFDFYGTGFDVISSTSSDTGTLVVTVTHVENGETVTDRNLVVNTYYGYKLTNQYMFYVYTKDGWIYKGHSYDLGFAKEVDTLPEDVEISNQLYAIYGPFWVPAADGTDGLFQIPVMKVTDLPYGKYSVTITAAYNRMLDIPGDGNYDLYLDAIRIYDPTGVVSGATENETVSNAYKADGEGWAKYSELRDIILAAGTFGEGIDSAAGAVFIDHDPAGTYSITDYAAYGPNNELYLAEEQMVAFILDPSLQYKEYNLADVQIGLKSANEVQGEVYATLTTYTESDGNYTSNSSTAPIDPIAAGTTATDRYYSIGTHVNKTGETILSIQNTGSGILSITNIKLTFTEEPTALENGTGTFAMTRSVADGILLAMNTAEDAVEEPDEVLDAELSVSLNKQSVKVGGTVQVKVTTSSDVDSLRVNGQEITKFKQNNKTGKRTWTVKVTAEEAGDLNIEVIAYSADGKTLDSVVETVEVTAKKSGNVNKTVGQLLGKLFG